MIVKRIFDLFLSSTGLVILLPMYFILALWIKLDSPGPVFFRQARVGLRGKPFHIYKFRTMDADAESTGHQITVGDDTRITRSGRLLRRYKLDELPQLMNVFIGEMSLVGPRPEVPRYVEMFKEAYETILTVKPGITDYAAIEFRDEEEALKKYPDPDDAYINEILPQKIELYKRYLKDENVWTDLRIIYLTLRKIFNK